MQISIFDVESEQFKIKKSVKLIELFAGFGSQYLSLKYIAQETKNLIVESHKICEWAVNSIQAYKDLHFGNDNKDYSIDLTDEQVLDYLVKKGISKDYNEPMTVEQIKRLGVEKQRTIYNNIQATHNLVNITQVKGSDLEITDTDKYDYIMTYSFPCQDLSVAGKLKGMAKGSGTRSGLLWEVERLLDECKEYNGNLPKVLLMENVPEVIGTNNAKDFAMWLIKLESIGYKCFWKSLNAKKFGVPQNRERVFMISLLGDYYYDFPKEIPLEKTVENILEHNVPEKYYLTDRALNGLENTEFSSAKLENRTETGGVMRTLLARDYKDPKLVVEDEQEIN